MSLDMEKFRDLFVSEAEERIASLSNILLEIEKTQGRPDQYAALMQSAHTIKGSAATMQFTQIAQLAHALEDVFHLAERGALVPDSTLITTLLSSIDVLSAALARIKNNEIEISTAKNVEILRALLQSPKGAPHSEAAKKMESPSVESTLVTTPNVVKVSTDKLDILMGIFEELLLLQLKLDAMLLPAMELASATTDSAWKQKLFFVHEFRSLFGEMSHLLSENQDALLAIRLVQLDQIFGQYPRMVRDLAVREGKKVEFIISGGDVALDRTVIDGLGGALAHLLRNAVDHGIVSEGIIRLSASRVHGRVKVVVEDNGAGIDYARVREIAISRGIETKERVLAMSQNTLAEIIFHPNMSTNNEVTDVSGRGVGVSAVYVFARDVGGRLEVLSPIPEVGRGTRFTLDLPVSLATVRVLVVEVGGYMFAIPFEHIKRMHEFTEGEVTPAAHQETLFVDGEVLPLLRLKKIMGLAFGPPVAPSIVEKNHVAVLVRVGKMGMAIHVDASIGERDLLVKSLPPALHGIKGFSGSALLPDGRTILLLDMHGLLTHAVGDILEHTAR